MMLARVNQKSDAIFENLTTTAIIFGHTLKR